MLLVATTLVGCGKKKSVQIKGVLENGDAGIVYLQELTSDQKSVKDSCQLSSDGSFLFKQEIEQPTFYSLTAYGKAVTLLAHPGDKIVINGDAHNLNKTYNIKGSNDSKYILILSQRMDATQAIEDSLNRALEQYSENRNYANIRKQFEWDYLTEIDNLREFNIQFIDQNPTSLVAIYALYQQLAPNFYLFSRDGDIKYFRACDSIFYKLYPKVTYVKSLHANVVEMNEQIRIRQFNQMVALLAKPAPEIALPSLNGKVIKLSDYKGQYVLVDFWASWSPLSRTENHPLIQVYNEYHPQGFEIFQVSLDKDKNAWERAVTEDGLTWIHVSDLKYWDSEVAKAYGVETVPTNFLIDRDGIVIARELWGDKLSQKLTELFAAEQNP